MNMDCGKAVMAILANWTGAATVAIVLLIVVEWLMPGSVLPFVDLVDWLLPAAVLCSAFTLFAGPSSMGMRIAQAVVIAGVFGLALAFLAARVENYGAYSLAFLASAGISLAAWVWAAVKPEKED